MHMPAYLYNVYQFNNKIITIKFLFGIIMS